ncbi:MAG: ATP-dependent Clp protease proteolytic subunit [Spirochaetales bacterium]|nr:ATP-dependent Clp protease proteolytic subunit [Spirochaetales bacterium]
MINRAKNIFYITATITMLSITISILYSMINNKGQDQDNISIARQISNEIPNILESINDEGFHELNIDYNDPVLLSRNVYITNDLDEYESLKVMNKLKYLESIDTKKEINLYIHTSGGYGGIMLANYIQSIGCPINTIALDLCASAGCELLVSGTGKRKAFSSSRIIVHLVTDSNSDSDHEKYNSKNLQNKVNVLFWKKHSGLPENYYTNIEKGIYYCFTSEEALKNGIIDEIID